MSIGSSTCQPEALVLGSAASSVDASASPPVPDLRRLRPPRERRRRLPPASPSPSSEPLARVVAVASVGSVDSSAVRLPGRHCRPWPWRRRRDGDATGSGALKERDDAPDAGWAGAAPSSARLRRRPLLARLLAGRLRLGFLSPTSCGLLGQAWPCESPPLSRRLVLLGGCLLLGRRLLGLLGLVVGRGRLGGVAACLGSAFSSAQPAARRGGWLRGAGRRDGCGLLVRWFRMWSWCCRRRALCSSCPRAHRRRAGGGSVVEARRAVSPPVGLTQACGGASRGGSGVAAVEAATTHRRRTTHREESSGRSAVAWRWHCGVAIRIERITHGAGFCVERALGDPSLPWRNRCLQAGNRREDRQGCRRVSRRVFHAVRPCPVSHTPGHRPARRAPTGSPRRPGSRRCGCPSWSSARPRPRRGPGTASTADCGLGASGTREARPPTHPPRAGRPALPARPRRHRRCRDRPAAPRRAAAYDVGVALPEHPDLEVLRLTGRSGRRRVGVRDPRVRVETGRVRDRDARPAHGTLERPTEVAVAGEAQPAALGVADPDLLDRWRLLGGLFTHVPTIVPPAQAT